MSATAVPATQSTGNHEHSQSHTPMSPNSQATPSDSTTALSATLVNTATTVNERPSIKLKIIGGKTNIVNSVVINTDRQSLYTISSSSKRTTVVACKDNVEVATVEWDRSSPRMVFRQKKMKCREWLPLAGPETESRTLTHGALQFTWMNKSSTSGYLIPANRPGLSIARWCIRSISDNLDLEVFQEELVEPELLEAIVVSIVLLRSGRSLGDAILERTAKSPRFFGNTRFPGM